MKKIFTLLFVLFFSIANISFAQCPGCIIDYGCVISPAKPTLCPDTLPPGTAMQYYDEDITFYMPAEFEDAGTGFTVTLNRIEVTGVIGMPLGLSFESSSPTNNFYPSSNPPATEHGCAKFCGTPLLPGNYIITVFVKAYVTVLGMNQTEDDYFDIPITILPSASGNNSFTMSNPYACAPVVTDFSVLHPSNGNPNFTYSWTFGNGQTSNSETPPQQTYTNPGIYSVNLVTTIDTLGYYLSTVSVSNLQCDDGIWGSPDPYIKIFEGLTKIYESAYVDDTYSATFNFSTISLNDTIYKIEVWDYDSGLLGGDDFCGQVTFNGHTPGNYSLNASGMIVSFTVDHPVIEFNDTDTVTVLANPNITGLSIDPSHMMCVGDSVLLTVLSNGTEWQWYRDTLALLGHTNDWMFAHETGNYYVLVSNDFGCSTFSNEEQISFLNYPPIPTFWQTGNMLQTMMTGYFLQWYLNGDPVFGGINQTLQITQSGMYVLEAMNNIGCNTFSNEYYATYTGIEDFAGLQHLSISPNPAHDVLFIRFDNESNNQILISIVDLTGRTIIYESYDIYNGQNSLSVHVEHIASGIYIIELQTISGKTSARFVKK